ncbi:hypothetical protein ACFW2T_13365 [Streptomyces sp. NPDC058892]|uniref:hypothetical protein n=1 Tax=unclassified Streptomyces TaxID=2593676 RepID=UPI0036BDB1E5
MTLVPHANDTSVPTPVELRRHVARATGRLRDTAMHVGRLVEDRTPGPVLAAAWRTATRVRDTAARSGRLTGHPRRGPVRAKAARAASLARSHRTALATAAGVLTVAVLARRSRRARREQ